MCPGNIRQQCGTGDEQSFASDMELTENPLEMGGLSGHRHLKSMDCLVLHDFFEQKRTFESHERWSQ